MVEFRLRDQMESPAFGRSELPSNLEFTLSNRFGESAGSLDLYQSLAAICHLDQEIGHDVADTGVRSILGAFLWRCFQQLDIERVALLMPPVPDRQGLFLDVRYGGASDKDRGCYAFELALTTD